MLMIVIVFLSDLCASAREMFLLSQCLPRPS
jgi:hypothetical protein